MAERHAHRKRRRLFRRQTAPGAPPGSLSANPDAHPTAIDVVAYDADHCVETGVRTTQQIQACRDRHALIWVNVDGLGDPAAIQQIGQMFGLHPLALEDVVHPHQRAKVEAYDSHLFIIARMLRLPESQQPQSTPAGNGAAESNGDATVMIGEQLSLFLGRDFVITFQETPGDCLEPVRQRLRKDIGRIRSRGTDHLAYALLDAVIDAYFPILERFGEELDFLDEEMNRPASPAALERIHAIKRDMMLIRRAAWPLREAIQNLQRDSHALILAETRVYLRDCYDHLIQIIDVIETHRELCADLRDYFFSLMSQRTNDIMKVLTVIATIFMPLSFIAGVYGMNFDRQASRWNMPELGWTYGYPFALSLMGGTIVGMLGYFWHKGWIWQGRRPPRFPRNTPRSAP